MRSKENCQSEIISAWSISALQAMDECPQGGFEVLEKMSLEIRKKLEDRKNQE